MMVAFQFFGYVFMGGAIMYYEVWRVMNSMSIVEKKGRETYDFRFSLADVFILALGGWVFMEGWLVLMNLIMDVLFS